MTSQRQSEPQPSQSFAPPLRRSTRQGGARYTERVWFRVRDRKVDLAVRAAVCNLPFTQARALWLVETCGCTYAQVAAETGADRQSVARDISDARTAILHHLDREGLLPLRPRTRRKALRR